MKIVIFTNDNFFSFTVLKDFLIKRKDDIQLIVFSSALIGKKGTFESVKWSIKNTGLMHTTFKLSVYGIFKLLKILCKILPFIKNNYSSFLWVKRNGLDFLVSPNVNSDEVINKLKEINSDLIVSVSMNQIVKKQILELPPKRCINVHCAPLPEYAGMSPYVWALANNEDHSAATIHYMEEGLDEGDIIVQDKVAVVKNDSAFALFYRCCIKASQQLIDVVNKIENNTVSSFRQDLNQKTYFSWPTKDCIKNLKGNGYKLATMKDFLLAIFKQEPRT
jgi:methionyl-tRNA formyltransferase